MYLFSKEYFCLEVELPKNKVINIIEKNMYDSIDGWVDDNNFELSLVSLYWTGSTPLFKGNISECNNITMIQGNIQASVFNIVMFITLIVLFIFLAIAIKDVLPIIPVILGLMIDMSVFVFRKDKMREHLVKMFYVDNL